MKIAIRLLYASILTIMMFIACNGEDAGPVTYTDAGDTVRVKVGQQFKIVLESNVTTGFKWQFTVPYDTTALKLVEHQYVAKPNPDNLMGRGGHDHWLFEVLKKGPATISLEYGQPWDSTSFEKTVEFKVEVAQE